MFLLFPFLVNCIDDKEAFDLLTPDVPKELIPQIGPRLKFSAKFRNYQKIEQDFRIIYGEETADSFITKGDTCAEKILTFCNSQEISWKPYFSIQLSDDHSLLALQMLPLVLPSGLVRNKRGKNLRASRAEALSAFIDIQPLCTLPLQVGTNLPHYLETCQAERQKTQPYILVLGDRLKPSQTFVVPDGVALEAGTLLKACDICFKAAYILDVHYPKQCQTTWEFIQKYFFQLGDGKGKSITSPGVRTLRTFLEASVESS
ncbi:hypothetical protein HOLleu_02962 [Holothuria leucospilota]|uniref:Uncharacterized protein n=1 Tax=Holothuria leucospilota TaxID=206669 RepID=A0A9Q1CSW6_HOLLE|nr:hypothetical protein HOLleu_02962 [Holothuria leucospilota]